MSEALCFLTVAEASRLVKARKLSPVELTEAYLARIESLGPQLDAFITVTADHARRQARRAERELARGHWRGPMHGIPVALKDIFDTRGILTSGHSRVGQDRVPKADAEVTRRLDEAGAVLLGKTATHEFAHGGPSFDLPWPPARNPWNLEHFTGGSSSGSGAAVAAGLTPAAMGSDTGGSIRGPASLCGIAGLMPSAGLVSRTGVIPNSFTFDHVGPMAWVVEDCAIVLQAIAGHDPRDGGSVEVKIPNYRAALREGVRGLKIGVLRQVWEQDVPQSDEVRSAMDHAVSVFRSLGVRCEDVRVRPTLDYNDVKVTIAETELLSIHARDLVSRPGDFGEDFLARVLPACLFQSTDYVQASREHRRMLAEAEPLWKKHDALLSVVFGPAPRLDAHSPLNFWRRPNANPMANVLGGPALAVCAGFSAQGLPIGLQLMARPFGETAVLRLGHAFEQATGTRARRPRLTAGATQPKIAPPSHEPKPPADLDTPTIELVTGMVRKCGLKLTERQLAMVLEAAPAVLAMADRVRRLHDRDVEPANTFRVPGGSLTAGRPHRIYRVMA
jgi:aspartyl-tRNA(Asn)/glutamyl-tRNA(Gln) amidotransferase subunit A